MNGITGTHIESGFVQAQIDWEKFHQEYMSLVNHYDPNYRLSINELRFEFLRDPTKLNRCLLNEDDGSIVAVVQATRLVFKNWRQLHLNRLYVRPDMTYRNLGYTCLSWIEQKGLEKFSRSKEPFQFLVELSPVSPYRYFFQYNGYCHAYLEGSSSVYIKNV
jgi:hypothetical protein